MSECCTNDLNTGEFLFCVFLALDDHLPVVSLLTLCAWSTGLHLRCLYYVWCIYLLCVWLALAQPSARTTGDSSSVTQWPSLSFPYFLSTLCVNMGVKHQDKFSFCMSCFSTSSALIKISLIHFRTWLVWWSYSRYSTVYWLEWVSYLLQPSSCSGVCKQAVGRLATVLREFHHPGPRNIKHDCGQCKVWHR